MSGGGKNVFFVVNAASGPVAIPRIQPPIRAVHAEGWCVVPSNCANEAHSLGRAASWEVPASAPGLIVLASAWPQVLRRSCLRRGVSSVRPGLLDPWLSHQNRSKDAGVARSPAPIGGGRAAPASGGAATPPPPPAEWIRCSPLPLPAVSRGPGPAGPASRSRPAASPSRSPADAGPPPPRRPCDAACPRG